jgi:hypothetical protein
MAEWLNLTVFGITLLIMLVGLFGLIVPIFPGIVVIWLAALGYGVVTGFTTPGWILFAVITLLMIAGVLVDNVLLAAGARQGGASWRSVLIAVIAGVLGTIFFPPIGGLVAAPAAIFLFEYWRLRDGPKALAALQGLAAGWGMAFIVRFGIGVLMIVFWGIWVWKG